MLLRACIELAIDSATTLPDLSAWWREHQPALQRLTPHDLGQVVALKDHRKRLLASN